MVQRQLPAASHLTATPPDPGPPDAGASASAAPRPPLQLQGVSKLFGSFVALHPIDLRFEPGQTTALIGPSGCGKSTILRLLNGLLEPSSGQVLFGSQLLAGANLLSLRRRMGYVIQEGGLFPHLNVRQNIVLLAAHLRWSTAQMQARLEQLCALTRLPAELLQRYPAELSGGQRQRVSLSRALMLKPDVLLLDEPMAALDPMSRASLQLELKALFQLLGQTVVLVTHELAEAATLGQRLVLLRQGRLLQSGSFKELRDHPVEPFVSDFINAQRTVALA